MYVYTKKKSFYFHCTDFHISPVAFLRSVALEITKKIFQDFFIPWVEMESYQIFHLLHFHQLLNPHTELRNIIHLLLKTNQMKTW